MKSETTLSNQLELLQRQVDPIILAIKVLSLNNPKRLIYEAQVVLIQSDIDSIQKKIDELSNLLLPVTNPRKQLEQLYTNQD